MRRVPSNSSYLNKISHSNLNVRQALHTSNEAATTGTSGKKRLGGTAGLLA